MLLNFQLFTTTKTLSAGVATLVVGARNNRQYLFLQNTGTGSVTFGTTSGVTAGLGFVILDPASTANGQGGSAEYTTQIPTNPIYAISTAGTTITVSEGG